LPEKIAYYHHNSKTTFVEWIAQLNNEMWKGYNGVNKSENQYNVLSFFTQHFSNIFTYGIPRHKFSAGDFPFSKS